MNLLARQKTIGIISILSGLLALASIIAGLIGVNYNSDAFSDPLLILTTPGTNIGAARYSMIFDMFGYYLLLLPVIYLLQEWIKTRSAWSNVITFSGLAYILIGGIGAAILAIAWPSILSAYPAATPDTQLILKNNFKFINDMVYGGMWNLLEILLAGVWWLWTGIIFYRNKYSFIGILTIITGVSCLADSAAGIFQIASLHTIALNCYLLFAILWAVVLGIFLLRKPLNLTPAPL
jgi:hypothetical protein